MAPEMEDILSKISEVRPPLRLCSIQKTEGVACGFHLSRTQWDPYPWISNVDDASPAAAAGLTIGDFVIEVNGEDILGLRIDEVAQKVRLKNNVVNLLVWKSAVTETENKLPAAFNLQKFSGFLQSTLQLIECPVCLDISSIPTYQCVNGHILCRHCRQKTAKCPMCRVPLSSNGRCLTAEKLHRLIRKTLSVKSFQDKTEPLTEGIGSAKKPFPHATVKYHCPLRDCSQNLFGDKAVLRHLHKCHNGPIIQYSIRGEKLTIAEKNPGAVICIVTSQDELFFLQQLPTREFWISILGDEARANQFLFKIEPAGENQTTETYQNVSSLSEPPDSIIRRKDYFIVPISALEIVISIITQTKSKAVNS